MGVYIKGIEMPKNCGECFACKAELSQEKKVIYVCCFTREEYGFNGNCMNDCPLISVLSHGRLIDADALHVEVKKHATPSDAWVFSFIRTAPPSSKQRRVSDE